MQVELVTFLSICTAILGVIFGFMGQARASKRDIKAEDAKTNAFESQQAVIVTKLDNISQTLKDIKDDQKITSGDIKEINKRLTIVESDLKLAWSQIDELKGVK